MSSCLPSSARAGTAGGYAATSPAWAPAWPMGTVTSSPSTGSAMASRGPVSTRWSRCVAPPSPDPAHLLPQPELTLTLPVAGLLWEQRHDQRDLPRRHRERPLRDHGRYLLEGHQALPGGEGPPGALSFPLSSPGQVAAAGAPDARAMHSLSVLSQESGSRGPRAKPPASLGGGSLRPPPPLPHGPAPSLLSQGRLCLG